MEIKCLEIGTVPLQLAVLDKKKLQNNGVSYWFIVVISYQSPKEKKKNLEAIQMGIYGL